MLPFGMIEQIIRLIVLLIEGIPIAYRAATAVALYHIWKPILWGILDDEGQKAVEATIAQFQPPKGVESG